MGASCIWPGESSSCRRRPFSFTRRCSLVVKPPRLRPIQASPLCFLDGSLLVNAHRGRVDHLHFAAMSHNDGVHQLVPDARFQPAVEAVVNRRVRPISFRQINPGRAGPKMMKNAVQNPTVINPRNASRLVRLKWLDCPPLILGQVISPMCHVQSPVSEIESLDN